MKSRPVQRALPETAASPPMKITLGDVYFTIFRHKGKIVTILLLALGVAVGMYFRWPVLYRSEAKLSIRYVVETKSPSQVGADAKVKTPDDQGAGVIFTEVEILTSLDVAQEAAESVGPERILPKTSTATNRLAAAVTFISEHLTVKPPSRGNVIQLMFEHPDQEIVRPVLSQIIAGYMKKHVEVHRAVGVFDEFLTQQTEQIRSRLSATEERLRHAKAKAKIVSLEDSKKVYGEEVSRVRLAILDAEAELVQHQAKLAELSRIYITNRLQGSNGAVPSAAAALVALAPPSPEALEEYHRHAEQLESLTKREHELLLQFTPENAMVKSVRAQIQAAQRGLRQMESDNPALLTAKLSAGGSGLPDNSAGQQAEFALATETSLVAALQSKIKKLEEQLAQIDQEGVVLYDAEERITELQRQRELEESQYKYFTANLEQARFDEQLGAGKNANISVVQAPSPPLRSSRNLLKKVGLVLAGGLALALGIPFAIELLLDQTVKRPVEVQKRLRLPLMMSVPYRHGHGERRALNGNHAGRELGWQPEPAKSPAAGQAAAVGEGELPAPVAAEVAAGGCAPWDSQHRLRPYWDALRDRLITWFEVKQMTHKPKLVAVTSCAGGSGVSTISAGLAASLSETGDGNVLLVDMNRPNGLVQQFFQGGLACGLDEALMQEKRETALVQDNLYVVREHAIGQKPRSFLPKRFTNLVPRMKASDYDYIIFDMPPVSQVSITPRLARFMDMVLVVVEAEKTDREVVKGAAALLTEAEANISLVLNKTRSYVPRLLQQEL